MHSALTLPAGAGGIWRQEDFQGFGQGVAINGLSAAGGTWTLVTAGLNTCTADWFDGDSYMLFSMSSARFTTSSSIISIGRAVRLSMGSGYTQISIIGLSYPAGVSLEIPDFIAFVPYS